MPFSGLYKILCQLFRFSYDLLFISHDPKKLDCIAGRSPSLKDLIAEENIILFNLFLKMVILINCFQQMGQLNIMSCSKADTIARRDPSPLGVCLLRPRKRPRGCVAPVCVGAER